MCARREEEESHEADGWGHARKEKRTVRPGGLDRGERRRERLGRLGRNRRPKTGRLVLDFSKKKDQQREKHFGGILEKKKNT